MTVYCSSAVKGLSIQAFKHSSGSSIQAVFLSLLFLGYDAVYYGSGQVDILAFFGHVFAVVNDLVTANRDVPVTKRDDINFLPAMRTCCFRHTLNPPFEYSCP